MDFVAAGGSRAWFSDEQAIDVEEEDKESPLSSSAPHHHHNPMLPNYPYSSSSSSSSHFNRSSPQHPIHQIPPSNSHGPWINSHSNHGDNTNSAPKCGENEAAVIEREHMFDKVVTPSDVGKLNRLVIPKQHAEKYFPLDSSTNEKGLLLNFEDRGGKPWRFRYSYWNSSQSYVMTKGWSRFVKEKKLDAGDIVSFQRGLGELGKDRLYIDWRRRPDAPDPALHHFSFARSTVPWTPFFMRPPIPSTVSFATQSQREHAHLPRLPNRNFYSGGSYGYNVVNPVYYMGSTAPQQLQASEGAVVFESVPVVQGKAAAKRLRLFGVNMECPISEEPDECDILSSNTTSNTSTSQPIAPNHHHLHSQYSSSPPPSFHPLQLRLYNGNPHPTTQTDFLRKGKTSTSFDLDI